MSDVIQVNPLVFGGNGGVEIPFLTKLWENPDPTSEFAAQTINLASSDYDFLMFTYRYVTTDSLDLSKTFKKGDKVVLDCSFATSAGARAFTRLINYTSDTSLTAGQAQYATAGTAATIANNFLIPLAIYGLKKSYDIEDVAIANVSTSATQCIMSDNVTTVENAITALGNSIIFNGPTLKVVSSGSVVQIIFANAGIANGDNLSPLLGGKLPKLDTAGIVSDINSSNLYWLRINTSGVVNIITLGGAEASISIGTSGTLTYVAN